MRWTTHQIAGVGLAVVCGVALDVSTASAVVLGGAACVGSALPDADRAGSKVYRRTRLERRVWPLGLVGAVARVPLRLLILLGHRGLTHSLLACAAFGLACWALVSLVAPGLAVAAGAGLALGYGAHIAADACTPSGIALWAPLSGRRRWLLPRSARIPTGSLRELAVAALLLASVAASVALMG
ncbi:metal-dependent hydrolase [Solirubrobacter soli]|uniref:metal-dependent hydrolase n=1 Tax=Solirubrobacter soli TaxID=363832 RepID=UPI000403E9CE|nr:metal-dependent hydrolase [Solirubrobacter soli]